jgi:hypothetical protein
VPSPTPVELTDINPVARTTGKDAILDALVLRLHTETACRCGGALNLRVMDLDTDRGLPLPREKGGTVRWQPDQTPPRTRLADRAHIRGAVLTNTLRSCGRNASAARRAAGRRGRRNSRGSFSASRGAILRDGRASS